MFAIVATGAALFQRAASSAKAEDFAEEALHFRAGLAARQVDAAVTEVQTAIDAVAENRSLRQLFGAEITPGCSLAFNGAGPFASGHLDIISRAGSVRCSSRDLPARPIYADAAWLRDAAREPTVTGPFVDPATGIRTVVVTTPVRGLGAVVAFLDLDGVTAGFVERLSGPVESRFSLVPLSTATTSDDIDGKITATAHVASLNWELDASTPRADAVADAHAVSRELMWYLVFAFVVLLLATQLMYRRMALPIQRLSRVVRATAPGDVPVGLASSGPAEVMSLGLDVTALTRAVHDELTQRRAAESGLREAQRDRDSHAAMLSVIVDSSRALIYVKDLDGRYLMVNPAFEAAVRQSESDIVGNTDELISPELAAELGAHDRQAEQGRYQFQARYRGPDGDRIYDVTKFPLTNDAGAVYAICSVSVDVTDQLRASAAAAEAHDAIAEARDAALAATAAKSAFLATMSHEIRTPMNAVIGMTELLAETDLDSQQREFVEMVRASGDALIAVINDILDFSKIDSGQLVLEAAPFPLRDEVEGCLELVAGAAKAKGLVLLVDVDDRCGPTVIGDAVRLRQIVTNLLSNAVKFTSQGHVIVEGSCQPLDDGIEVTLSVSDTGIGIAPDSLDRLFTSFSQVDASTTRVYGGTGLGLAISQRLAEAMGGGIEVQSIPGEGSTFRVTVVLGRAPDKGHPSQPAGVEPELAGADVLLVDDYELSRHTTARQLTRLGMHCTTAANGQEARRLVAEGLNYQVALLNKHGRNDAAVGLGSWLREGSHSSAQSPLIQLTSLGWRPARRDHPFVAFVTKPVRTTRLIDALKHALGDAPSRSPGSNAEDSRFDGEGALRVLLAEDNPVNQRVGELMLRKLGHRVDVVGDGMEAVAAAAAHHYDVVLMDIQMPVLDGLAAARRIREKGASQQQPYMVALTASTLDGDRDASTAAGMDAYLTKPIRISDLARALQNAPSSAGDGHSVTGGGASMTVAPARCDVGHDVAGIDLDILEALLRDVSGQRDLDDVLLRTFLDESRGLVQAIVTASRASDWPTVRTDAHTLRSSCALFGATTMATLLTQAEAAATGAPQDVPSLVADVGQEFARVAEGLEQRLTSSTTGSSPPT